MDCQSLLNKAPHLPATTTHQNNDHHIGYPISEPDIAPVIQQIMSDEQQQQKTTSATTSTTMQAFHFPGTTVNFTHAMVTPGHVRTLQDGFNFTAEGQPFLWTNPDFMGIVTQQEEQKPGTKTLGQQAEACPGRIVNADSGVDVFQRPLKKALSNRDSQPNYQLPQETLHQAILSGNNTGPTIPPYPTPPSSIRNNFPAAPVLSRVQDIHQQNIASPAAFATVGREFARNPWGHDGTSALSGWYAEDIDVRRTLSGQLHGSGNATSTPWRPATSFQVSADQHIKDHLDSTIRTHASSSPSAIRGEETHGSKIADEHLPRQLSYSSLAVTNDGQTKGDLVIAVDALCEKYKLSKPRHLHLESVTSANPHLVQHCPAYFNDSELPLPTAPATSFGTQLHAQVPPGPQHAIQQSHDPLLYDASRYPAPGQPFAFSLDPSSDGDYAQYIGFGQHQGYPGLPGYIDQGAWGRTPHYPSPGHHQLSHLVAEPRPYSDFFPSAANQLEPEKARHPTPSHAPRHPYMNASTDTSFVFPSRGPLAQDHDGGPFHLRGISDHLCGRPPMSMAEVTPVQADKLSHADLQWSNCVPAARSGSQASLVPTLVSVLDSRPGTGIMQRPHLDSGHPSGRCYSGDPFLRPSGSVTASVRPATAQPSTSTTTKSLQAQRSKATAKRKASVLEDGRSMLEDIGKHIARVRERGSCVTALDDGEGMNHFSVAHPQSRSSQSTERKVASRDAQGKVQISQILQPTVRSTLTSSAAMQGPVKRQRRIGDCDRSPAHRQDRMICSRDSDTPLRNVRGSSVHGYELRSAIRKRKPKYESASDDADESEDVHD